MQHRNLTTTKIIQTTQALLANRGLNDITFSVVAKELGIHSQALYNYFNNRTDLLDAALAQKLTQVHHQLLQAIVGLTGHDALITISQELRRMALANPELAKALLTVPANQNYSRSVVAGRTLFDTINKLMATQIVGAKAVVNHTRAYRSGITGFLLSELAGWFDNPLQSRTVSYNQLIELLITPLPTETQKKSATDPI